MPEILSVLVRPLPFQFDDDSAAEGGVGQLAPFEPDRLRTEGGEQRRLVRLTLTPNDALAADPAGIDDLAKIFIAAKDRIGLIDHERRLPFFDRTKQGRGADAN